MLRNFVAMFLRVDVDRSSTTCWNVMLCQVPQKLRLWTRVDQLKRTIKDRVGIQENAGKATFETSGQRRNGKKQCRNMSKE